MVYEDWTGRTHDLYVEVMIFYMRCPLLCTPTRYQTWMHVIIPN